MKGKERRQKRRKGTDKIRKGKRKMERKGGVKKNIPAKKEVQERKKWKSPRRYQVGELSDYGFIHMGDNQGHLSELTLKMRKLNCRGFGRWRRQELDGPVL